MASPTHDNMHLTSEQGGLHDEEMQDYNGDPGDEDGEGEGDVIMPNANDDSSEEDEEDAEEEARIREGFIVDEDDEEDDEEGEEERRRRRKRRKKHHRRREEDEEGLEDDDLELLAENTGTTFKKSKLTRLRRARTSESPEPSSKRKTILESSDDDLDVPHISRRDQDIEKIWDDDRRDQEEAYDDMDMDDFIDDDDDDEGGAPLDEEARAARRMEKMQEQERRKKARRARPELVGIDANAWDEIYDVFGDGHEYDWAMEGDDEFQEEQEIVKQEMKYQDVFEPSEIRHRMLTEDDDLIRAQDIPERMQLATASISQTTSISLHTQLTQEDIGGAALWVTQRLSYNKTRDFFSPDGNKQHLKGSLVMAVTYALGSLFIDEFEVPYIWNNKRDFIRHFDVDDVGKREELITLSELWRIYTLGQKYRSLLERKKSVLASFKRLGVSDSYFEEDILPRMDSVEFIVDTIEWLTMKYKAQKQASEQDFQFHDDEDVEVSKKRKMPSRVSAYELAKKSPLAKLADGFGLEPSEIVRNFQSGTQTHFVHDQELNPLAYAEQFADPDPAKALSADEILRRARMIISTELGKDPILRAQIRKLFQEEAQISVSPTERGISKIDEHHFYYNFKYLHNKPASDMLQSPQFLRMLQAESELLITISINLPADSKANFERRLTEAFSSDGFGDSTRGWNEERARVIQEVLEQHLIPGGIKWLREYIREEVEDTLTETCAYELRTRVDVAPFRTGDMANGDIPSVLAVSWGKGDPQKDAVTCVYLDEEGRMREHTKIDNLVDNELMDEFIDIIRRRKPSVIVIGGLSPTTLKLSHTVKTLIGSPDALPRDDQQLNGFDQPPPNREHFDIPVVYSFDDVARIYSHSDRAEEEFSHLSLTARYCVGLARYMQSPINEFAALGSDITAVTLVDRVQQLLPKEKLLVAFERVLVDVVNKVGVDINKAITDDYYQHLLPFVCGLGPRKARLMISKINGLGGSLVNREQFIKNGILTTKIFLNAAGFLTIFQDFNGDLRQKGRGEEEAPDPLDSTRVHPEDYELARKMATDALELDEEDVHDEHPSQVVSAIMQDRDSEKKLNELNLDDFAISLYESNQDQKRHTLNVIKTELLHPFGEQRGEFRLPDEWKIVTMLSGESDDSLRVGLIVTCQVTRIQKQFVTVRLDSGLEGVIKLPYLTDQVPDHPGKAVAKGQTLPGVIIDRKLDLKHDSFEVELSSRPSDTVAGDAQFRRIKHDDHWDSIHCDKDNELLARKKRAEVDRTRRIIKHPNFHNFTSSQAETFLAQQQRGDVVIRPSSKGVHHLAVTWKVDDGLYQHINVTDPNADPTGQTVGDQLVVDNTHTYADLDELIVNHVQAMARRCEELMAHEKFKQGSEDDLHLFLKNFLAANPAKSMYGFTLNRKKPGHFNLCFLANKNSHVQTWPVRVTPEAYYLFEAAAVGVPELCDAFKVRHLHESQNASTMAGGKTPYGAGGRTPARPMGGATPGRMSVRQVGRTPNPYGGATPRAPVPQPNAYGMPPPGPSQYGAPPSAPFGGYQTPSHRPPQSHPGMPPPSIPNGWGGGGGGGGGWS